MTSRSARLMEALASIPGLQQYDMGSTGDAGTTGPEPGADQDGGSGEGGPSACAHCTVHALAASHTR